MKRMISMACALALMLALAACSGGTQHGSAKSGGASSQPGSAMSSGGASGVLQEPGTSDASSSWLEENQSGAVLYIGMDGQFQEYSLETEETVTPEVLVAGIAELTGWNLDLADAITTGKGGITVTFAETSALFVGPPEVQKDEFHVFDVFQLDQTILDSVKKTLQSWAVVPGLGDPDSVDIYFCGPKGDLVLEGLGVTISSTEPYRAFPEM